MHFPEPPLSARALRRDSEAYGTIVNWEREVTKRQKQFPVIYISLLKFWQHLRREPFAKRTLKV
jgi:hypothetical protein